MSTIQAAWPQLGTLESLTITARNGFGDWGGRVTSMTLVGSSQNVVVTGDQFAAACNLRSDWFIPTDALPSAAVGMASTSDGKGYWIAGADGAVRAFGDATELRLGGRTAAGRTGGGHRGHPGRQGLLGGGGRRRDLHLRRRRLLRLGRSAST